MSADEFFTGMTGVIEQVINDGIRLEWEMKATPELVRGLATNVAAQIMQNIEAEYMPRVEQ